jgi:hypothetical protein
MTRDLLSTPSAHCFVIESDRQRFSRSLNRREADRVYEHKLDGRVEAQFIAFVCSDPPEGHSRWSLHLLANELVTLDEIDVESLSHEIVRQILKNATTPRRSKSGVIESGENASFVCKTDDVLDLYHEPYVLLITPLDQFHALFAILIR